MYARFIKRATVLIVGTGLGMSWTIPAAAQVMSPIDRMSESRIVVRADSAATYAVQGGRVVRLVPSTNAQGRTVFTIDVQKGRHLFQVVVDPVTDEVLAVAKKH